jgi:hypothetical protein
MLITYRRTAGLLALLTLAAVALAAMVLTIAVAATLAVGIAAAALIGRAVRPWSWRRRTVPSATAWPHKTLVATVVEAASSAETRDLRHMDQDAR